MSEMLSAKVLSSVKVECFHRFINLVVNFLCLVVKMGHLVVIFEHLVVKNMDLVVIVK